ncbi:hypothetical protein SO694_00194037 [Aureococcus anophagefferens]|uniref:Uncharacterized protein n=1 Tax=Aureococcus anophagefferens TaxID=44056 RepID=A0ABR1FNV3_AURAN
MRYWADAEVPAPAGAVPAYDVEAYLTFVPDFGGWNNSYYLLTACKAAEGGCEYSLADFAPPLLAARSRARDFVRGVLRRSPPRLAAEGRLADDVEWPPRKKVTNAAARCTPRHKATDSCFPLASGSTLSLVADFVPDTEGGVVIFGKARAQRVFGDDFTEARVAKLRYDPPEWRRDGLAALARTRRRQGRKRVMQRRFNVDGDKELRDNRLARAVVHLRTAGWKTHGADAKHVDRAGRLLTPFYAYAADVDPAANNFYKRLVRDVVRHSDAVTCAAAAIVTWLGRMGGPAVPGADAAFSSLHARMNEFQFGESGNLAAETLRDAVGRSLGAREALYVATDAPDRATFDAIRHRGHRVVLLSDAILASTRARRNATGPLPLKYAKDWNGVSMTPAEAAAVAAVGRNEHGLVDVLVAAQGRAFTGTWFSTLTTHVQRIRGYVGRPDESTFFSMATRWAACQRWYMREFPTAWRGIAGDDQPGPRPGEGVYNGPKDGVDYQQKGYPADGAAADPRTRPFPVRR